jgi:hypothetical protein
MHDGNLAGQFSASDLIPYRNDEKALRRSPARLRDRESAPHIDMHQGAARYSAT